MQPASDNKKIVAWAFYDWANSAFATTIMAAFFPVFFKQYWSGPEVTAVESTFRWGVANSVSSLAIVVLAPILGALADRGGAKKRFLAVSTLLGVLTTGALYFVGQGNWPAAAVLYALGLLGFSAGNIFYDALIVSIARPARFHAVSALGYAMGYLGGGILLTLNVVMARKPELFGIADPTQAVRVSFLLVAAWWLVFSLPLFAFVPEERRPEGKIPPGRVLHEAFRQLKDTFVEIRKLRVAFLFLVSYWLYIDGVDTIVRMAVDYGLNLGFDQAHLITALLITQFVGFPAAIAFGKLGEKIGAKRGIFIGLTVYAVTTFCSYFMDDVRDFYFLAATIGLVQGGVQALSRSLYASLIPKDKSAEFFGFYNMLGKFAAVIGPTLMGVVARLTGSARLSILSVLVLFVAGALLLARVDVAAGRRAVGDLEPS